MVVLRQYEPELSEYAIRITRSCLMVSISYVATPKFPNLVTFRALFEVSNSTENMTNLQEIVTCGANLVSD